MVLAGLPRRVPDAAAICGCKPAISCARVTFRDTPFWLIISSSVSAAAAAGASWSMVGIDLSSSEEDGAAGAVDLAGHMPGTQRISTGLPF
jgi:hypothetical protein